MSPVRTALAALALTALLACESVLEPEVSIDVWLFASAVGGGVGRVVESITGSGHLQRPATRSNAEQFRTFSLQAQKHEDGSVSGTIHGKNHGSGTRFQVTISCFTIIDNEAWIGGIFVKSSSPRLPVGSEGFLRVVDNGEGKDAPPDRITFIPFAPPGSGLVQGFCDDTPLIFTFFDIEKGNIQIRP